MELLTCHICGIAKTPMVFYPSDIKTGKPSALVCMSCKKKKAPDRKTMTEVRKLWSASNEKVVKGKGSKNQSLRKILKNDNVIRGL